MKTTDLIALILYELGEGDKYGFELTKSIENLSNGKIVIKQATLYSVLKKLEKSKFISSYWQDSEIGGKRHYYKLTENGNLQLSTMPSIEAILKSALAEDEEIVNEQKEEITSTQSSQMSIETPVVENVSKEPVPTLKETVLPSSEVFNENSIDNLTETEINSSNASLLHENSQKSSERFAENKDVTKFTENAYTPLDSMQKMPSPKPRYDDKNHIEPKQISRDDIKFVDYVNFKQNPKYLKASKLAKNVWIRIALSSAYLIVALAICAIISNNTSSTTIGNIFLILGICLLIFTPTIYAYKYDKYKTRFQEGTFKFNVKTRLILAILIVLFVAIMLVVANLTIMKKSVSELFEIKNFMNFYSPLLITSVVFVDFIFGYIFIKKNLNKN